MNKTYVTILLSMLTCGLYAQNSTVPSGGEATGTGGTVSYSVGQVGYVSDVGATGSVGAGVQQPFEISIVTGAEFTDVTLNLSAYPNPITDYVILEIGDSEITGLQFELLDINGKLLQKDDLSAQTTEIGMRDLSNATYLLKVSDRTKIVKTFRIIKRK